MVTVSTLLPAQGREQVLWGCKGHYVQHLDRVKKGQVQVILVVCCPCTSLFYWKYSLYIYIG